MRLSCLTDSLFLATLPWKNSPMGNCCCPPRPPPLPIISPSVDPTSERPSSIIPPHADSQVQIDQHFGNIKDAADLDPLIRYIDQLLSQTKKQEQSIQSTKPDSSKTREFVTNNIEGASELVEHISAEGEALRKANLASNLPEEMGNVARRALKGVGNLHWVAVGLSVIAFALERIHEVSSNFDKCVDLLDTMFALAKCLQKQYTRMPNESEPLTKMVFAIVEGAASCCSCMTQGKLFKYLFASTDNEKLQRIESVLAKAQGELSLMIGTDVQERVTDMQEQMPHRYSVSKYKAPDAVGIEDRVNKVIQFLDVGSREQARAVILYGFGGVGKTTLADSVMSQLDFGGLKHSRIQLDEKQSDMKSYQEELCADLTKERLQFKDCSQGRQRLQDVLQKESMFIFIDNALRKEQISDLLPLDLSLPAESRMLLTSRDKHVTNELRIRRISCVEYPVEELLPDAAKRFFREIVNRCEPSNSEVEVERISSDKMDAVAEQCHGVPLLLRVYAPYLARHGREPKAYNEMLAALKQGDFSHTDERVGAKLLYVYHQLRQDEQDAFVDACTYFHGWSKKDIFYILRQREFNALVDGALVSIDSYDKLVVHDVMRAMGIKLGKDNRVRSVHDWNRAFAEKKEIKGIWLTDLESKDVFSIESQYLSAVSGPLRVLAVGRQIRFTGECRISLPKLRFLHIQNPAEGLPIFERMDTFQYTCLIDNGENSLSSQTLLENIKNMPNIQKLQLHDYGAGKFSDDFRLANSMIELDLSNSNWLKKLPNEFDSLNSLQPLNSTWCESLVSLPDAFGGLSALQSLDLGWCRSLASLPDGFGGTGDLQRLDLQGCRSLSNLPNEFGKLSALQSLDLRGCENLTSLPNEFGRLNSLQDLNMSNCFKLKSLSDDFENLRKLQDLDLSNCPKLESNTIEKLMKLPSLQCLVIQRSAKLKMKWKEIPKEKFSFRVKGAEDDLRFTRVFHENSLEGVLPQPLSSSGRGTELHGLCRFYIHVAIGTVFYFTYRELKDMLMEMLNGELGRIKQKAGQIAFERIDYIMRVNNATCNVCTQSQMDMISFHLL